MSIGEAALANLQSQINNLQTQVNNLQSEITAQGQEISQFETYVGTQLNNIQTTFNNLQTTVNNLQTALNNKVNISSQLSGYQGLFVPGNLNGYLDVFKVQLLSTDNPQFFIFNWMQLNGSVVSYTNDVQWPVTATPRMYYQTGNFIVAPAVYTISSQGCVYQMQFNSSAHTFHLYIQSKLLADDEKTFKKLGITLPTKDDITTDEIVKEFSTDEKKQSQEREQRQQEQSKDGIVKKTQDGSSKQPPSTPLIGANNDYVSFLVMAFY
jgi:hypothetical protein